VAANNTKALSYGQVFYSVTTETVIGHFFQFLQSFKKLLQKKILFNNSFQIQFFKSFFAFAKFFGENIYASSLRFFAAIPRLVSVPPWLTQHKEDHLY